MKATVERQSPFFMRGLAALRQDFEGQRNFFGEPLLFHKTNAKHFLEENKDLKNATIATLDGMFFCATGLHAGEEIAETLDGMGALEIAAITPAPIARIWRARHKAATRDDRNTKARERKVFARLHHTEGCRRARAIAALTDAVAFASCDLDLVLDFCFPIIQENEQEIKNAKEEIKEIDRQLRALFARRKECKAEIASCKEEIAARKEEIARARAEFGAEVAPIEAQIARLSRRAA